MSSRTQGRDQRLDGMGPSQGTTMDGALYLLSNSRRRLLVALLDVYNQFPFPDAVEEVTKAEHGDQWGSTERKAVYISLHQCHVPTLEEAGVIEVDSSGAGRMLQQGPNFDTLRNLYDSARDELGTDAPAPLATSSTQDGGAR